jgi:hypothetical protein
VPAESHDREIGLILGLFRIFFATAPVLSGATAFMKIYKPVARQNNYLERHGAGSETIQTSSLQRRRASYCER